MNKTLIFAIVLIISTHVTPVFAESNDSLQQRINALLQQIAQLQMQLSVPGGECAGSIALNHGLGSVHPEVRQIQKFLNQTPATQVAVSGFGSPGQETMFYGLRTAAAVSRFQATHKSDILTPSNLDVPTGYFGNATRNKMNSLCMSTSPTTPVVPSSPVIKDEKAEDKMITAPRSGRSRGEGNTSTSNPAPVEPEELIEPVATRKIEYGLSFPPVSTTEQLAFTADALKDLKINRVRFAEDWKNRETQVDTFNWEPLDARIQWAEDNNIDLFLTIQSDGPTWRCASSNSRSCVFADNNDFKVYIETLLQRYPNQIKRIQFGNEWQTEFWYVGTAQEYVTAANILYDAVTTYSPQTTVALGGFTTASLRYLAACTGLVDEILNDDGSYTRGQNIQLLCASNEYINGLARVDYVLQNANYDEIDIHLYDDPEYWTEYTQAINSRIAVNTPIVVTEFGGPHMFAEPTDEAYQATRLQDYITKLETLPIIEAYYFKLVEGTNNPVHEFTGLYTQDLRKKLNYDVLRRQTIKPLE